MSKIKKNEKRGVPKVMGPYSPVVVAGDFIFCSGQIAIDPVIGQILPGDIIIQTKRAIENLKNVLATVNCGLHQVVRTEVYLKNMADFDSMNKIYAKYFTFRPKPSRVTVEVSELPKCALLEISCIAYKK